MAIVGASGGCGKSTIASLLASLCARAGLVTLAIDADLQFGDMHRMLGVHEPVRMDEVVANPSLMTRLNEDAKSTGKPSSSRRPRVWNLLKKLLVSCLISSMPHGAITTLSWRALAHFGAKSMHVLSNQPIQLSSSWTLVPHRSKPRCMPLNYAHAWGLRRAVSFTRLTSTSVRACFLPLTHRAP